MCTYNGYYTTFDEKELGSLETGKIADMVVLSANPYDIEKSELRNLKVEKLYLGGHAYRSCKESVAGTVLRGLTSHSKC